MKPLLIGITGGIGAGKSTVCRVLKELGYPVYDADSAAKSLLQNDQQIIDSVKLLLGAASYKNHVPDRQFIAQQVYDDPEKLQALNQIIHPAVALNFKNWVAVNSHHKMLFKEAAILFESGSAGEMDLIIAVDAPVAVRMKRIIQRDGRTEMEIRRIMDSQLTSDELKSKSDFVIINDDQHPLLIQIQSTLKTISDSVATDNQFL